MNDLLKIVSLLSLGAGPFLSDKVPAMPPDLQRWSLWVSGIAALVGLVWTKVRLKDPVDPKRGWRHLVVSGVAAVVFAVLYFAIALVWRTIDDAGGE